MSDTWGLWGLVEADTHEASYPGPCGDVYCIRVAHGDPSLWQQTEEGWDHPEGFRIRPSTEREGWQLWAPAASMGGEAWAKLHAPSGSLQDQFDSLHRQLSPKPLLPWRRAAVEIPYIRNNGGVRQWAQPDDYGQKIEPWGRYMSDGQWSSGPLNPGWERGNVSFDNPMHVQHNDGNWKQELSQAHGGLTGQALSDALLAKGHDGVVTHDKYGIGEIVDLRPKDQRGHQVMHVARTASTDEFPQFGHQLPNAPGPHPDEFWGGGGCGHMALAFHSMWPDLKIGADIDNRDGTVNHAWVHDGKRSHDFMGTHDTPDAPAGMFPNATTHMDMDPKHLASIFGRGGIRWSPEEPWNDDTVYEASEEIAKHWLGHKPLAHDDDW